MSYYYPPAPSSHRSHRSRRRANSIGYQQPSMYMSSPSVPIQQQQIQPYYYPAAPYTPTATYAQQPVVQPIVQPVVYTPSHHHHHRSRSRRNSRRSVMSKRTPSRSRSRRHRSLSPHHHHHHRSHSSHSHHRHHHDDDYRPTIGERIKKFFGIESYNRSPVTSRNVGRYNSLRGTKGFLDAETSHNRARSMSDSRGASRWFGSGRRGSVGGRYVDKHGRECDERGRAMYTV